MTQFPYATNYLPPAPIFEIQLGLPTEALQPEALNALVDTGADLCVIPIAYLERLGAESDDRRFIRTPWSRRLAVDIYLLDIGIGQNRFPSIQVIGDEQGTEVIIGRNLLNKLNLNLNGPQHSLEIF